MNFENIEVGQSVLILKMVKTGFQRGRQYYVPEEVVKVTKTQFTTKSGIRAKKDSGSIIGDYGYVYELSHAEDQTKDFENFELYVKKGIAVKMLVQEIATKLSQGQIFHIEENKVDKITKALIEIKKEIEL